MNATHSVSRTNQVTQIVSIRKNRSSRDEILTVRFSGEQLDPIRPRPIARANDTFSYRAKRAEIDGCGPDLFFAEWDFVDEKLNAESA